MENGNFCLIWNYNLLVVRKFFAVTLVKKILSKHFKISDTFISEILSIWTDINYEANIYSTEQLKAQNLWQNSVGNIPIHNKSWSSKGVRNVGHLMKDSIQFLSFEDFKEHFNIKTNFLTFQGVLSAIKALYGKATKKIYTILPPTMELSLISHFFKGKTTKQTSI